jgi:hypothetical protein
MSPKIIAFVSGMSIRIVPLTMSSSLKYQR